MGIEERDSELKERRDNIMKFTLKEAQELFDFFGGEDAEVTVEEVNNDGHSGKGLYAFFTEYPEEGSVFLGRKE